MQKIAIGTLVLLVLFLAGINARLRSRERFLEERLVTVEKKARRKPAPVIPLVPEPATIVLCEPGLPSTPPPPVPATPAPPLPAQTQVLESLTTPVAVFRDTFTIVSTVSDESLGLTETQQKAIDELRKNGDERVQAYSDLITRIEEETERAVRLLLDPQQLAKYDAQRSPVIDVSGNVELSVVASPEETPTTASGRKPGYLGIHGGDASGGGARVNSVIENTVASGLGLRKDDVILEFNGEAIPNLNVLTARVRETGEGGPAHLKIRRGGTEFYQGLQLGPLPR